MRVINEIWIIDPSGITLYNLSKEQNIDAGLFGGFFTAIQNFISSLGEKELKSLVLGSSKLMIYHGNQDFLFISRSDMKSKEKKIVQYLKLIEKKFFDLYGQKIKNWDGEVSIFDNFGDIIEEIFEDKPEKDMEAAFDYMNSKPLVPTPDGQKNVIMKISET